MDGIALTYKNQPSMRHTFYWAATLLLLAACHSGAHPDDPALLQGVLTDYFAAIGTHDTAKLQALTTDDFILYEDGLVWNNDSAFKNIRRHLPFTVKFTFRHARSVSNPDCRLESPTLLLFFMT